MRVSGVKSVQYANFMATSNTDAKNSSKVTRKDEVTENKTRIKERDLGNKIDTYV